MAENIGENEDHCYLGDQNKLSINLEQTNVEKKDGLLVTEQAGQVKRSSNVNPLRL